MPNAVFQRNPRNVRIAAWVLAGSAFAAWWSYDRKKEREFSDAEVATWNQEVLSTTRTKSEKERATK